MGEKQEKNVSQNNIHITYTLFVLS